LMLRRSYGTVPHGVVFWYLADNATQPWLAFADMIYG